jgi:hypothetical protein
LRTVILSAVIRNDLSSQFIIAGDRFTKQREHYN